MIIHLKSNARRVRMYKSECPDCYMKFSRKDVMLRHHRNKHQGNVMNLPKGENHFPKCSESRKSERDNEMFFAIQ